MCLNKVEQYVPRGYDYVAVTMKCGDTSIHGTPLYCEPCDEANDIRGHAAHQCKHGRDLYPEDGRDINCFQCEIGD